MSRKLGSYQYFTNKYDINILHKIHKRNQEFGKCGNKKIKPCNWSSWNLPPYHHLARALEGLRGAVVIF
jgi:hypothetical protein